MGWWSEVEGAGMMDWWIDEWDLIEAERWQGLSYFGSWGYFGAMIAADLLNHVRLDAARPWANSLLVKPGALGPMDDMTDKEADALTTPVNPLLIATA